jgi:hypothetical protein
LVPLIEGLRLAALNTDLRGVGDEEIVRIRFETQPAVVARGFKDRRHAVVDLTHQLVGRHGDDGEGSIPFSSVRIAPALPQSR